MRTRHNRLKMVHRVVIRPEFRAEISSPDLLKMVGLSTRGGVSTIILALVGAAVVGKVGHQSWKIMFFIMHDTRSHCSAWMSCPVMLSLSVHYYLLLIVIICVLCFFIMRVFGLYYWRKTSDTEKKGDNKR